MDRAGKEGGRGVGTSASGEEKKERRFQNISYQFRDRWMGGKTYSPRFRVGTDLLIALSALISRDALCWGQIGYPWTHLPPAGCRFVHWPTWS